MSVRVMRVILAAGMLLSTAAMAQAAGPVAEACRPDIQQFCAGLDRGQIAQCLKDHARQLSSGCVAAVKVQRAQKAAGAAPAALPYAPAAGAPVPAAAAGALPYSPAPAAGGYPPPAGGAPGPAAGARPGAMAAMEVCRPDLAAVCPGVQPGGGRIAQCLRANFRVLSPPCKQALLAMWAGQGAPASPPGPNY
jgi:hypothetical protein